MAEQLTGRQQVIARIEVANRLGQKYKAEARGLADALHYEMPREYFPDAEEQRTYLMGWTEGREILKVHGADEREVA